MNSLLPSNEQVYLLMLRQKSDCAQRNNGKAAIFLRHSRDLQNSRIWAITKNSCILPQITKNLTHLIC